MNIDSLKIELLTDIVNTTDQSVITKLRDYLASLKTEPQNSDELLHEIEASLEDSKNGRTRNHATVKADLKKWQQSASK